MGTFNFTKAPWDHFDKSDLSIWGSEIRVIVCHIKETESKGELTSEHLYNALLISKAPEILEMLKRTVDLLNDINSTLFHHNHSIDGWHLNGDLEPIMNFVAEMDIEVISEAEQLIKSATEL